LGVTNPDGIRIIAKNRCSPGEVGGTGSHRDGIQQGHWQGNVIPGRGKFFVENVGEVTLEPGTFVVILPNTLPGVDAVEEEVGALDV